MVWFESPPSRLKKSPVLDSLVEFDKDCICREILSFYERELEKVKQPPICFTGAYLLSFTRLWKKNGFRYKKVESGRKLLMERKDIVLDKEYVRMAFFL